MITSVEIIDNTYTPLIYLKELKSFRTGAKYEFKKGINIIVGPNGCGKSTLIKLISSFTFCENTMVTELPKEVIEYSKIFKDDTENILDGVKIHHDYLGVVFRYKPSIEMKEADINNCFENFSLYLNSNSASVGEKTLEGIYALFKLMFSDQKNYSFPIDKLKKLSENANSYWKHRFENLLEYYKENRCKVTKEDYEYTVLLDEPDRNLDIENIQSIYNILSYRKPQTQLICVIHNPILIYKLSKLDYINWIEMENGYIDKIKNLIKDLVK